MRIFQYLADFIGLDRRHVFLLQNAQPLLRRLLRQQRFRYLIHLRHVLAPGFLVDEALFLQYLGMPSRVKEADPALVSIGRYRDVAVLCPHRLARRIELARIAPGARWWHESLVAQVL